MDCVRFRFSFRCNGKSDGLPENMTITSLVEDTLAVLKFFHNDENLVKKLDFANISCVGYDLGGLVAILAAVHSKKIHNLVLLNPMFNSIDSFSRLLSPTIFQDQNPFVEVSHKFSLETKRLKREFFDDLFNFDSIAELINFHGHLLVIVSKYDEIALSQYGALSIKYHSKHNPKYRSQLLELETNHNFHSLETPLHIHKIISTSIEFMLAYKLQLEKPTVRGKWDQLLEELEDAEKKNEIIDTFS